MEICRWNQAYLELGKAYYEGGFEDPLPELLPLFDRITRLRSEAAGLGGSAGSCGCRCQRGEAGFRRKRGNE